MNVYKWIKKHWENLLACLFFGLSALTLVFYYLFFIRTVHSASQNVETTPRANLTLMHFNEGQPHLIFNDLAYFIDALTFPVLTDYPASVIPPEESNEGDMYIVPVDAEDEWYGHDNYLTMYRNASWNFIRPATGWIVNKPDFSALRYDGVEWTEWQGSVSTGSMIIQSRSGVPGINLQTDTSGAMVGITTGLANAEIIKVSEESTSASMFLLAKYSVGGAYLRLGPYSTSLYDGVDTLLLHPKDPSYFYGNLYVGGGSTGYAETPLVVAGAVTLMATDTPADPVNGQAVLWLDDSGNLRIKSNVGEVIKSGTLFEYVP